ncbi:MAG: hypothetical protein HY680_02370, partial [Chloroflexi bacterium]|nr:hypothetical protein [Chloroflexota bacterium]
MARQWLARLIDAPQSQDDLHRAFVAASLGEAPVSRTHSAWLDEAWTIEPAPLREAGATVSVIREEDLKHCLDGGGQADAARVIEYTIPMLYRPVAE